VQGCNADYLGRGLVYLQISYFTCTLYHVCKERKKQYLCPTTGAFNLSVSEILAAEVILQHAERIIPQHLYNKMSL